MESSAETLSTRDLLLTTATELPPDLDRQADGSRLLDQLLTASGDGEADLTEQIALRLRLPFTDFPVPEADQAQLLKEGFPAGLAHEHQILPLRFQDGEEPGSLVVATADPFDLQARQAVAQTVDHSVLWCLAPRTRLLEALRGFYGLAAGTFDEIIAGRAGMVGFEETDEANWIDADEEEASVIKFVNEIIREALRSRATDIHLEPMEHGLRVRFRVDGRLEKAPVPENISALQASVLTRIKVMAKLDIAEKRLPQDGRIHLKMGGESIDVRVATIPSVEGESISLRLLSREKFDLDLLAFPPDLRTKVDQLLGLPNGIVLVTGPTGCGKSTTLYTFLSEINSEDRRIVTIEDPVEHKLPGVVQIAVRSDIGLSFADGLRSVLRGDPNVVMIGEIRDVETAQIAVRASLTGHLVFSTLHTNDAIGGVNRLLDMGVEPFLIGSSVRALVAQRLVRRVCRQCAEFKPFQRDASIPDADLLEGHLVPEATVGQCSACRGTGYHGRLALYEVCLLSPELVEMIQKRAGHRDLFAQARREGFQTMREYGYAKVLAGDTTLEEVLMATVEEGAL